MTHELRLERVIDAPPEVVFEAFTTHGGQVAFYGTDEPGWIVESQCDLRVGGFWTVTFGPSRDHLYHHRNVFEVIDRPRRIVLATTELHPDRPALDFSVEFTFDGQDGKTLMTIIQSGFPTPELRDEHGRGVPNAFARLERHSREQIAATVLHIVGAGAVRALGDEPPPGYGVRRLEQQLGRAADDAVAESFFATLKRGLIRRRSWPERRELTSATLCWCSRRDAISLR